MSSRSLLIASAVMALASGAALAAEGDAPEGGAPAKGTTVTFCGLVIKDAECVTVLSEVHSYNIQGAKPVPEEGAMIAGSGKVGGSADICQNGAINLESVTWKAVEVCADAEGE